LGKSEISGPDAEGGGLGMKLVEMGSWRASGLSERARVFARRGPFSGRRDPAI